MHYRKFMGWATLSLLALSNCLSAVNALPIEIGGPIQISPTPGPANPDPILENLVLVMDNHYQPPYYPGGAPDYLSQIYYYSDAYIGSGIVFDPFDSRTVHFSISQNLITDLTGTFYYISLGTNTFATSHDKGATWSYGPPIEQIIPLGGTISQMINASIGPGLYYEFAKDGSLVGSGWGFFDTVATPPNAIPKSGFLFTRSDDNGVSWTPPEIVATNIGDYWIRVPNFARKAPGWFEFYTTNDPSNPEIIHCSTTIINGGGNDPRFSFPDSGGNLGPAYQVYFSSHDGGKTFSCPQVAYTLMDDPIWREKLFDPYYSYTSEWFEMGGYGNASGHPLVLGNEVIALPVRRVYPRQGSLTFQNNYTNTVCDQGLVISKDNGKTWCKAIGSTEQFTISPVTYDPGFWNPGIPQIVNGFESFGYTYDGGFAQSRNSNSAAQYSTSTGRIYLTYQATNPDYLSFEYNQPIAVCQLLLSSSADQGATWSPAAKVNRTPTNIEPRAQQAFGNSSALSVDGWYVVGYYDFRNWALNGGHPGEDLTTTPLLMDAWLAIYRETEDPLGGSTGAGLDFVGEICLTPGSFNARSNMINTAIPYIAPYFCGTPEGMPVAFNKDNELFAVYSMQNEITNSDIDTNGYKGMTIDKNSYQTLYLRRYKFPKATNQ